MTTAARRVRQPIPADKFSHGDPKRYRRGCRCQPCKDGITAETLRWKYLRSVGRSGLVPIGRAQRHVAKLRAAGMPNGDIRDAALIAPDVLRRVVNGDGALRYSTEARILAVPVPEQPGRSLLRVDSIGARRRLQALISLGWTRKGIAERIPTMDPAYLARLVHSEAPITAWTALRVEQAYTELSEAHPEESGVPDHDARRARAEATARQWAGPAAWDDDEIDNPQAIPDWTGHCGTDRGWWIHTTLKLPMCQACTDAHKQWKAEHRSLPRNEFMSAMHLARAAAATRGPAIAEDGRELIRLGHTTEQAAERLGITPDYLRQELLRHPEATTGQVAA